MAVSDDIKIALARALARTAVSVSAEDVPLEHPADISHGDYASGVALAKAKEADLSPRQLAEILLTDLGEIPGVEKVEVAGPGFINFTLTSQVFARSIEEARTTDMWGAGRANAGKKIMVEYTDPNPFKEFHIGHLMSNAVGESISRLLEFSGAEVKRANYQGDVGPHVAKAIWGKMQFHGATWGEAYVRGAAEYENHKEEIDAINKHVYEKDDTKINTLYETGRKESLEEFEKLYKILGTTFDHYFFESDTAPRGVGIVRAHPEIFVESDGAIVYKGEADGLHTRVFLTSKGLPTYEAKELGLAQLKGEMWGFDTSITITANEQSDYFDVVLAAMHKVLPAVAFRIQHISHGMMRFADGKMSSRTGNVITGTSLIDDLTDAAKARAGESRAENPEKLAERVAVAAIKYQILKQGSGKDIVFDRERALSLEGDSGPYLQYAYARTCAIAAKAKDLGVAPKADGTKIPNIVARLVHRFPEIVSYAGEMREPHLLTTYLIELASAFNAWYAQEQILDGTPAASHKLALVRAVRATLKNGLWLLAIPAPEKM